MSSSIQNHQNHQNQTAYHPVNMKGIQESLFPIPYSETDRMVLRNGIRFYNNLIFRIPYPVTSNYFKYYKLLYWSANHIIESIEAGMICRDDIAFRIHYNANLTRGKILHAANHESTALKQYALSFRAAYDGWSIDPVVIISEV
jgi:hypothetical protein